MKCVRETQTLKLSQLFSGAKDVSALLPLELDIYHEWIAKEIERKLAKDAQIVKSADWCLEKGSV